MAKANIHRRRSLEEVYPPDAFASDAARNGRVTGEVIFGVLILSAPDAAGEFEFEQASRQIGEAASPAFLAPSRPQGNPEGSADRDPQQGYQDFLGQLAAAAQRFGFAAEEAPGRGDARLRGLRQ